MKEQLLCVNRFIIFHLCKNVGNEDEPFCFGFFTQKIMPSIRICTLIWIRIGIQTLDPVWIRMKLMRIRNPVPNPV